MSIATIDGGSSLDTMKDMQGVEYTRLAIFAGLDTEQLVQLGRYFSEVTLEEGQFVFGQGSPAVAFFILLDGEVLVRYKPYDGPAMAVARIGPGEVFGWSAVLGREVYTSSAEVTRSGCAFSIRPVGLQRLRNAHPETGKMMMERLANSIADRLRNTNSSVLSLLSQGMHCQEVPK